MNPPRIFNTGRFQLFSLVQKRIVQKKDVSALPMDVPRRAPGARVAVYHVSYVS